MARYFKSGATTWNTAANWSATGSGGGDTAGVPTAADDVIFETGSGNCQINVNAVCRSLDCTSGAGNYGGTITYDTTARTLTIGTSTAGAGNVALKFVAGITYTAAATNTLNFATTQSTQQTITTAGKAMPNTVIGSAAGSTNCSYQYQDGYTSNSTTLTFTRGTLDLNGQTFGLSIFSSNNSNTRTLTLGASTINLAAGGGLNCVNFGTAGGLTVTANTATFNSTASQTNMSFNGQDFNGATFTANGFTALCALTVTGSPTFGSINITGPANLTATATISGDCTITGSLAINGNSASNRLYFGSSVRGTTRNITLGASATFKTSTTTQNLDVEDIAMTGGAANERDISAVTGKSGDCGGNSGITFTTSATQTFAGGASNVSTAASWTSRSPLPQDDVVVNTTTAGTLTQDMPRSGRDWNFTSFNQTYSVTVAAGSRFYGSMLLSSSMTFSASNIKVIASGRDSRTWTSNGLTWSTIFVVDSINGTLTFQDAQSNSSANSSPCQLVSGTLTTSNNNLTVTNSSGGPVLTMTGGTLNAGTSILRSNNNGGSIINITGGTVNAASATITRGDTAATARNIVGGGNVFGTFIPFQTTGASTTTTITDTGNTFSTISAQTLNNAQTLKFTSVTTTTINNPNITGASGKVITVSSTTGASAATINSPVQGLIGANSTSVSGNTGITVAAGTAMDWLSVQDITWNYTPAGSGIDNTLLLLGIGV